MDSIQGRNWKVGLDENTCLTCKHLSDGKLCLCLHSLITEEVEERVFPHLPSRVFISDYANKENKIFSCFL